MNDYSWFKLLIRAIGLVLLGIGVPSLLGTVGNLLAFLTYNSGSSGVNAILSWGAFACGTVFQLLLGVYLLRGGGRLTAHILASVVGRCVTCGYDVRTIAGTNCPECGTLLPGRAVVAGPGESKN